MWKSCPKGILHQQIFDKMLKCGLSFFVLVLSFVSRVNAITNYNAGSLDCSEVCFQDAFTGSSSAAETRRLQELLALSNRARRLRIKHAINATLLTIDTTISPEHAFEYDHAGIFTFQQHLSAFVAYTMPAWFGNPFYVNQFDGNQAWYCNNWGCNTRCSIAENILYDLEDVLESSTRGLIEDACHLGRRALRHDTCSLTNVWKNPLLISIVNSEFNDHQSRKYQSHHSSCKKFRHRLTVGTHASDMHQMRKFSSTTSNAFYFEDSPENKKTLASLVDCMQVECCVGSQASSNTKPVCVRTVPGKNINEFKFNWSLNLKKIIMSTI